MKISDMTIYQLRRALRERVLSAEGSKADLEIRLRADLEEDPDHLNKDEYEYEEAVSGMTPQLEQIISMITAQSEQINASLTAQSEQLDQINSSLTAQSEQITAQSEQLDQINSRITAQSEKLKSNIKEVFEDLSNDISEFIKDKVYKPNCNEVKGAASDLEYKAEGQTTLKANCTALCNGNAINEDNLNADDSHLDNIQTGPLTVEQKNDFIKHLKQLPEVVTERIGYTTTTTHKIICKSEEPIKQRPYSMNPDKRAFIYKKVQEMKNEGLIESLASGWASPRVLPKKNDGNYRLCVDFGKLKNQTISDAYPMPDLKSLLKKQFHNHLRTQSRRPVWKWKTTTKIVQKAEIATSEEHRKPKWTKKFMQRQVKRKIMKIQFIKQLKSEDKIKAEVISKSKMK